MRILEKTPTEDMTLPEYTNQHADHSSILEVVLLDGMAELHYLDKPEQIQQITVAETPESK